MHARGFLGHEASSLSRSFTQWSLWGRGSRVSGLVVGWVGGREGARVSGSVGVDG